MKTLYYLHIPKCGGKGFQNLIPILEKNNLSTFTIRTRNFSSYSDYAYISAHYGSDPLDKVVPSAAIFRDPLDRLISHFAWGMMSGEHIEHFDAYNLDANIEELFKHFLFDDEQMASNNNLQTKFVCNGIDKGIFEVRHTSNPEVYNPNIVIAVNGNPSGVITEWLIPNDKTSIEYAKSQVDKLAIIDTLENHDRFVTNVCNWFKENYDLDIEEEFKSSLVNENPTFNYSKFTDSKGNEWTTAKLKALLTEEEIARVYENNSLDLELYNYVKDKVQ
jgi:hypothetical protein